MPVRNWREAGHPWYIVEQNSFYQDLSLSEWLTHTPPELVMAHLNLDKATLDSIPREEVVVMPR